MRIAWMGNGMMIWDHCQTWTTLCYVIYKNKQLAESEISYFKKMGEWMVASPTL